MGRSRSLIVTVAVTLVLVLGIVFLVARCQADNDSCSDNSLGTTTVQTAAFSPSKHGGKSIFKRGGKPKPGKHSSGSGGIFIFHHDCD
ncbi:hypothetical protein [Streptomyces sp. NPDC006925]|uniref:hypothetical protein n=1 Tax=Streptomyces sp. NPDC006925 TaxID=3364768 RepID=UPI0036883F30